MGGWNGHRVGYCVSRDRRNNVGWVLVRWAVVLCGVLWGTTPARGAEATLVADSHVNSALPTNNSGAISNLKVGGGYTTLLDFDLSMLPTGTTPSQVSRAVLRLYCNRVTTAGLVTFAPINGSWGEYSVTYATEPAIGSAAVGFQAARRCGCWGIETGS